jgi:hypothetical protein
MDRYTAKVGTKSVTVKEAKFGWDVTVFVTDAGGRRETANYKATGSPLTVLAEALN